MNIEEKIFIKSSADYKKLLTYGFINDNDIYTYSKKILNNKFEVVVQINNEGKIKGKVIDLAFNEEYTNYRVSNIIGDFSGKIKDEFENILLDIKDKCFSEKYFVFNQSNRLTDYIIKKYNNKPEFLWKNDFTSGVFRNSSNGKWYGIIMYVLKSKIDSGNDKVEILNVKVKTEDIEYILLQKGFYKAYHMNKKNWVTIILDDSVDDNLIIKYIKESYNLTNK